LKYKWAMSSMTYVKRAVHDVETELKKVSKRLPARVMTPMTLGY
jgi:hypothetical protein